jgi:O-antigen/teichoic acid export membrane protein
MTDASSSSVESDAHVRGVTKKAVKSTAWTYLSYILSKGANLATTIILARLLTTAEFGVVGFALTAMSFLGRRARSRLGIGAHSAAR